MTVYVATRVWWIKKRFSLPNVLQTSSSVKSVTICCHAEECLSMVKLCLFILSYRLYRVAQIILVDDDTVTQNTGFYSCSFEKNAVTTGKFKRENTRITISILLVCNYLNTVNIYHQHFFYNTPTALDYETSTKMKQNYRPSLSTVMFSIMSHRRCIVSLTCLLQIPWHQCSTT